MKILVLNASPKGPNFPTVTPGKPIAYLINGPCRYDPSLRMIVESRAGVGA